MGCGLVFYHCRHSQEADMPFYCCTIHLEINIRTEPKPNRHCRIIIRHAAVDFMNHGNPPTWVGVEPTALGAEDQRQTNYAIQVARWRKY
ncbi:hypothetical protein TNCV_29811 [Trichonephila clavipes]|nr:hypothetical protein TNCV_29811 [Trichonephila clavipes]